MERAWGERQFCLFEYLFNGISTPYGLFNTEFWFIYKGLIGGNPRDTMSKLLHCVLEVSEFEFQLRYHVPFQTKILGQNMGPPYPPDYVLISTTSLV